MGDVVKNNDELAVLGSDANKYSEGEKLFIQKRKNAFQKALAKFFPTEIDKITEEQEKSFMIKAYAHKKNILTQQYDYEEQVLNIILTGKLKAGGVTIDKQVADHITTELGIFLKNLEQKRESQLAELDIKFNELENKPKHRRDREEAYLTELVDMLYDTYGKMMFDFKQTMEAEVKKL